MNYRPTKLPPTKKPHIFKYRTGKRKCWRCIATVDGDTLRHDATEPVFAYRGIMRKIQTIRYYGSDFRERLVRR